MNKLSLFLLGGLIATSACVNPERVQETKVTDSSMSCQDIADEIGQLAAVREEAARGQGASGANVAAVLLFWPAAVGNYVNSKDALEAVEDREATLAQLSAQNNCSFVTG